MKINRSSQTSSNYIVFCQVPNLGVNPAAATIDLGSTEATEPYMLYLLAVNRFTPGENVDYIHIQL